MREQLNKQVRTTGFSIEDFAADLEDDDAEELPNAFAYNMQCSDHLFYELLGLWHNAEPNRREDERETLRALIME